MKKALFQPFDLTKWFRVGFTAWLAGLTDCNGGGNGGNGSGNGSADWDDFFNFPQTAQDWLFDNPLYFNLIILGVVLLIIFISVMIWISSRGKFMFLHNVIYDKAEINHPWKDYRKEGNSLFLWRFFFGWLAFLLFILFAIYCFKTSKSLYLNDLPGTTVFLAIAKMISIFIAYLIIIGYTSLFLNDFVIPIMYKQRIGASIAWMKFLPLFGRYFFSFILYGLFIFILGTGVVIGVILAGLLTCCIGLLLLAIPYIGAVILLPVSYTFRAFSIEFLAQFGKDFNVFPLSDESTLQ